MVYLASALVHMQAADDEIRVRDWRYHQSALEYLGLETAALDEIRRGSREAVKNYRAMLAGA